MVEDLERAIEKSVAHLQPKDSNKKNDPQNPPDVGFKDPISKHLSGKDDSFKTPVDEEAASNKEPITGPETLDFSTNPGQQVFGTNPNVDMPYRTTVISEAGRSNPSNPNGGLVFNPPNPPNPNGGLVFNSMNPSNPPNPNGGLVFNSMNSSNPPNPNGGLVFNPSNPSKSPNPPNPNGGLVFNSMNSSNPPNPSNQNGGLVLTPTNAVPQPPLILRLTVWICFSRSHKTFSISSKTPKDKQNEIIRYVNVPLYNWIHFIDIFIFI